MLLAIRPVDGQGRLGAGRRIAVLGDMLELGPDENAMHAAIARHPGLKGIAVIHCVGPRMRHLWSILPRGQRGEWVESAGELAARARVLVDAGDVVLVKGSKGSKVSLVVDALRKLAKTG
jgi:UDP-N-acetylmuramoyl-tripeptide--D-alanyl-D-alanine ligase